MGTLENHILGQIQTLMLRLQCSQWHMKHGLQHIKRGEQNSNSSVKLGVWKSCTISPAGGENFTHPPTEAEGKPWLRRRLGWGQEK